MHTAPCLHFSVLLDVHRNPTIFLRNTVLSGYDARNVLCQIPDYLHGASNPTYPYSLEVVCSNRSASHTLIMD